MTAGQRALPGAAFGALPPWQRVLTDHRHILFAVLSVFVFVTVIYPLLQVAGRSVIVDGALSLANYTQVFALRRNWIAVWNSVWVSVVATVLATAIGVVTAFLVQRTDIPSMRLAAGTDFRRSRRL